MIRLPSKEETNAAGIIINTPETEKKRIDNGIVAKVGPGRQAGNGVVMPIQVK
jgi:co-chaperonin GroES (HSP10)